MAIKSVWDQFQFNRNGSVCILDAVGQNTAIQRVEEQECGADTII